jgi:hypothetical protein
LVTTSKTSLSVAVRFSVPSARQALKGDQEDPVDDDALGRTRQRPAALRVPPRWSVE